MLGTGGVLLDKAEEDGHDLHTDLGEELLLLDVLAIADGHLENV